MKGPFGILLLGGGIILLIGLFTGKITFSGSGSPLPTAVQKLSPIQQLLYQATGTVGQNAAIAPAKIGGPALVNVNPDGTCPAGKNQVIVANGKLMCQ